MNNFRDICDQIEINLAPVVQWRRRMCPFGYRCASKCVLKQGGSNSISNNNHRVEMCELRLYPSSESGRSGKVMSSLSEEVIWKAYLFAARFQVESYTLSLAIFHRYTPMDSVPLAQSVDSAPQKKRSGRGAYFNCLVSRFSIIILIWLVTNIAQSRCLHPQHAIVVESIGINVLGLLNLQCVKGARQWIVVRRAHTFQYLIGA